MKNKTVYSLHSLHEGAFNKGEVEEGQEEL
jgi:hypothetical protein